MIVSARGVYAQKPLVRAPFELKGMIRGRDGGIVVLQYSDVSGKWIQDTARVVNAKFIFKGQLLEPTLAYLVGNVESISVDDPNRKKLFLEPGAMTADMSEGDFQHARIAGSRTQQDMEELNNKITPLREGLAAIRRGWPKTGKTDSRPQQVQEQQAAAFDSLIKKENQVKYRFVANHPRSFASPYLMSLYRNDGIGEDSARKLYSGFSSDVKNSYWGLVVLKEMRARESTQPGNPAPNFVKRDSKGNLIRLSSFKGKSYVLLDFWASWCEPCRALSPHLRELYSTYHSKGLEIVGVSADTDEGKWKRAIAEDSTGNWTQIGKYLNGGAKVDGIEQHFDVQSWPTIILIDKQGNIAGRYAGGEDLTMEDLDNKLREIFVSGAATRITIDISPK
jgi:thiol-disulfide isomerase/thioredoxin